jgi:hypothetical protein
MPEIREKFQSARPGFRNEAPTGFRTNASQPEVNYRRLWLRTPLKKLLNSLHQFLILLHSLGDLIVPLYIHTLILHSRDHRLV